jgi:magnesium transporter
VTEVLHGLGAAERRRVMALRAQGRFFWLDVSVADTSREDLAELLGLAGRALQALPRSGDDRATRELRVDGASIAFALRCYVAPADAADQGAPVRPILVRVVVTGDYLLTLHEERVSLPAVLAPDLPPDRGPRYAVYAVLDEIVASTFDALEDVELTLDELAATWTDEDGAPISGTQLREAGIRLATMRRWATAEQAVFGRLGVEMRAMPAFGADEEPSFDRLSDQVNRLLASIDAAANGMGMLLDLQLNQRAYLVSVVATIFVPLTFITGFFGMNFGWMVDHIGGPVAFVLLGLAPGRHRGGGVAAVRPPAAGRGPATAAGDAAGSFASHGSSERWTGSLSSAIVGAAYVRRPRPT